MDYTIISTLHSIVYLQNYYNHRSNEFVEWLNFVNFMHFFRMKLKPISNNSCYAKDSIGNNTSQLNTIFNFMAEP